MRMKYKPGVIEADELRVGDVRRFDLNEGGEPTTFIGVVVGIDSDHVKVRRCYREDRGNCGYQMRDVGTTGLEYALFIGRDDRALDRRTAGRCYGHLSRRDMRSIRK